LICSLSSLIICIGWLPGIICGHLAKAGIRRDPSLKGGGLATAGLIISYVTLLFGVGLVAASVLWWSTIFKQAYQQAEQIMATNKAVAAQVQTQPETASNNVEQAQANSPGPANGSGWTMDVKNAQIPDSPITGQIHGQDFAVKRAIFHAGNIKFTTTKNGPSVLLLGLGTNISDNTFEVDPNATGNCPQVEISWREDGQNQTQDFDSGYAMQLKFDPAQGRKFHGHIYLCLPDDSKSYIAGAFTASLPRPKAPKPAPQQ
jgi:hypothetical protein